jgi:amino acid adenylation domain-containing protein
LLSTPEVLHDYLPLAAERHPGKTAVRLGADALSYGELESASGRLARLLVTAGCRPGDRVCLLAPKAPRVVLAMHAVLKAGCSYVPIDSSSPPARVERIVRAVEPALVLGTRDARELLDALSELGVSVRVGSLEDPIEGRSFRSDFSGDDLASFSAERPPVHTRPADLAHILFTSGSTGIPKGVAITHANVIHFVEWARSHFRLEDDDRLSGHSPFHFDLSTFDIYGSLSAGAELHLVPPELNLLAPKLAGFIRETRLTQWFSVPSAMTLVAKTDSIPRDSLPDLRRVLWCGEVIPTPTLAYWMERVPQATFTNLYGPTEATIASSHHTVSGIPTSGREPIPIGRAIAGEELLVLDERLRPTPPGDIGHLYIAGAGLSPGYWRDDEATEEAFIPDPRPGHQGRIYRTGDLARVDVDGVVFFLGREDTQVKARGHRVELGEVELALGATDGLKEFAVVAADSEAVGGVEICCAYVPADGAEAGPAQLRQALRQQLPAYMLPTRWLELATLPKNANGKIDRPRIRELFHEGTIV